MWRWRRRGSSKKRSPWSARRTRSRRCAAGSALIPARGSARGGTSTFRSRYGASSGSWPIARRSRPSPSCRRPRSRRSRSSAADPRGSPVRTDSASWATPRPCSKRCRWRVECWRPASRSSGSPGKTSGGTSTTSRAGGLRSRRTTRSTTSRSCSRKATAPSTSPPGRGVRGSSTLRARTSGACTTGSTSCPTSTWVRRWRSGRG